MERTIFEYMEYGIYGIWNYEYNTCTVYFVPKNRWGGEVFTFNNALILTVIVFYLPLYER